jgi:hypothetical protein
MISANKEEIYRDANGDRVPVWLREPFQFRVEMMQALTDLHGLQYRLIRKETDYGGQVVDWDAVYRHMAGIEQEIMSALPYVMCECKGACGECQGRGWYSMRDLVNKQRPLLRER